MALKKYELSSDPEWLKLAWADHGQKEIKGSRDNPLVVQYFKDVGHGWVKDDETAWCAAFVGSCLARAGLPHTGSLAARSYLQWGSKTTRPKRGDIVVFKRGNSSWQGHVAFYLGSDSKYVYVLGGNQSNMVKVSRYAKSKLLGYRAPTTLATSRTYKAAGAGAGAGVLALVGQGAEVAKEAQMGLEMTGLDWAMILAGFIGVAAAAVVIWARWDDWRQKAR